MLKNRFAAVMLVLFSSLIVLNTVGCQAPKKPEVKNKTLINHNRDLPIRNGPVIPRGTFRGHVTDAKTGNLIRGVNIRVLNRRGMEVGTTTSETTGFYKISVASGSYTLEARTTGYAVQQQIGTVDSKEEITVDFNLKPEPKL